MASIHKHSSGRSPFWFCKFIDANGRTLVKSTKKSDRSQAMTICLAWERVGKDKHLTGAQCRKVIGEILEQTTGESLPQSTAKEFLENWLKMKTANKSEGTGIRYAGTVRMFLESLKNRKHQTIAGIAPKDIEKFRDEQSAIGKAGSSVNVDLKTLRTAFNLARRQGLITNNPVDAVELPKEERHKREVFTDEELQALLAAADGEWKTAIMFGYYCGARLGDAITMTWESVEFEKSMVRYTQQKTKREVKCPLHSDLESYLLGLPITSRDPKAFVTPGLAGQPVGGRNGLSRQFKDLMTKARVADGRIESAGGIGRSFSQKSFHSLRHSHVSALANQGVSDEIRMKISGHTNSSVHAGYSKHTAETLKAEMAKLPAIKRK